MRAPALVRVVTAAVCVSFAAVPVSAQVQVLDFEDVPTVPNSGSPVTVFLPNVHHGFMFGGGSPSQQGQQWSWVTSRLLWKNYMPAHSGDVAVWANANMWLGMSRAVPFNLHSIYMRQNICREQVPYSLEIAGFGPMGVVGKLITLSCTQYQRFDFEWQNVTSLYFSALTTNGTLIIDDVSYSDVGALTAPEPATLALLGTGVLGLVIVGKRRRGEG
jgi:hypothetical protein